MRKILDGWTLDPSGVGFYHVRRDGGYRAGGLIVGGRNRWTVELNGQQWPTVYPSRRAAAVALCRHHDGEARP